MDRTDKSQNLYEIVVKSESDVSVEGLLPREIQLIRLLGDNGYTSGIDYNKIRSHEWYITGNTGNPKVYAMTKGVKGIDYPSICAQLGIKPSSVSPLLKGLEERAGYILRLDDFNSERMLHTIKRKKSSRKEVVLTKTGSDLYKRINEAILDYKAKEKKEAELMAKWGIDSKVLNFDI
jgi:DNA-binding MarR family transcriptional regulator